MPEAMSPTAPAVAALRGARTITACAPRLDGALLVSARCTERKPDVVPRRGCLRGPRPEPGGAARPLPRWREQAPRDDPAPRGAFCPGPSPKRSRRPAHRSAGALLEDDRGGAHMHDGALLVGRELEPARDERGGGHRVLGQIIRRDRAPGRPPPSRDRALRAGRERSGARYRSSMYRTCQSNLSSLFLSLSPTKSLPGSVQTPISSKW